MSKSVLSTVVRLSVSQQQLIALQEVIYYITENVVAMATDSDDIGDIQVAILRIESLFQMGRPFCDIEIHRIVAIDNDFAIWLVVFLTYYFRQYDKDSHLLASIILDRHNKDDVSIYSPKGARDLDRDIECLETIQVDCIAQLHLS